jgi:hypothetical protein
MRPTQPSGIQLETSLVMTWYLPEDVLVAGSDGLPGEILRGNSPFCLRPNRLADPQTGSFRNRGGVLRHPGNPVRMESLEIRIAMKADA